MSSRSTPLPIPPVGWHSVLHRAPEVLQAHRLGIIGSGQQDLSLELLPLDDGINQLRVGGGGFDRTDVGAAFLHQPLVVAVLPGQR